VNDAPVPPAVREDPWELVEEIDETLGSTGPVEIRSERLLYGDRALREKVREATGIDRQWRSFFASRLTLTPSLPAGSGDLVVRTVAAPIARSRFASDLRDRGFESVTAEETTRLTVAGGRRARLVRFSAGIPVDDDGSDRTADRPDGATGGPDGEADGPDRGTHVSAGESGSVDAEALLAIWAREEDMVAAGGTYPVGRLPTADGEAVFDPPAEYRRELLDLVRAVE